MNISQLGIFMRRQVGKWYHNALCHPGESRTELSITQHITGKIYLKQYRMFALNANLANF